MMPEINKDIYLAEEITSNIDLAGKSNYHIAMEFLKLTKNHSQAVCDIVIDNLKQSGYDFLDDLDAEYRED